jgi:hypothetical protein
MGSIFLKTLIMFVLAFIISMFVAVLIYWIRGLLTSVKMNSLFDEKAKLMVKRAIRIHKIHDMSLARISENIEHELHPELFDFYDGINEEFRQPEDFHGVLKPIVRRKRSIKKHKNL